MNAGRDPHEKPFVGKPLRRREDVRFLRGKGRYVDDVALPGMHVVRLRAQPACARAYSRHRDRRGQGSPGVLLMLTAADWRRAGHGELTVVHPMPFSDGRPMNDAPRPAFATTRCATSATSSRRSWPRTDSPPKMAAEAVAVDYEASAGGLRLARGGRSRRATRA